MPKQDIIIAIVLLWTLNVVYSDNSAELQEEIKQLKNIVKHQTEQLEYQGKLLAKLEDKIANIQESPLQPSIDDFVGFSAFLASGDKKLKNDVAVPFEGYQTNYGNHYDPETAKFTVPTDGVYFFTFNLYSSGLSKDSENYLSSGTLIVEDDPVIETFVKNGMKGGGFIAVQASNSILMQCKKGQKVWVESLQINNRIYGTVSARRTTFTGIRMVNLEAGGQKSETSKQEESCSPS